MRSSRLIAGAVAVALVTSCPGCASEDPFTLELFVNDESALTLSVDRGAIEAASATFWRVLASWNTYDEALAHPGVTLSNDQSSLTVRVRAAWTWIQSRAGLGHSSTRSEVLPWLSRERSRWTPARDGSAPTRVVTRPAQSPERIVGCWRVDGGPDPTRSARCRRRPRRRARSDVQDGTSIELVRQLRDQRVVQHDGDL